MGSHPSCTPNRIIRSRASQKSGVAKPTNTNSVVTLSNSRILAGGRQHADGHREGDDDDQLDDVQEQRDGQPLADLGQHGPAVGLERLAEVQAHDPAEPVPVLHVQRLVEAVELADLLDDLLGELPAQILLAARHRLAGRQVDHDERDEGDAEQQRDGEQQPAEREEEHLAGRVPLDLLRHVPLNEVVEDPGRAPAPRPARARTPPGAHPGSRGRPAAGPPRGPPGTGGSTSCAPAWWQEARPSSSRWSTSGLAYEIWFSCSGPVWDECQTLYWSGSVPTPQPRTMASKRFFLMNSLMNDAHSMTWISVFTPIVPRRCWMISATFLRSSLPWFVRIVNVNGLAVLVPQDAVAVCPSSPPRRGAPCAFAGS